MTTEPDPQDQTPAPQRPLDPQKVIRLANLSREVLEEVRNMGPDASNAKELAALYGRVHGQLKEALPEPLAEELDSMELELPFKDGVTTDEVRVVYSALIGWLGGLFQGLQATLLTQQLPVELSPARQAADYPNFDGPPPDRPQIPPAPAGKGEGYL